MTLLELQGVEKRFGGLPAVDDVSFGVDEGEILALVGPNGAGKSTLLKAISGLQPASAGRVILAGVDISKLKAHTVRGLGVSLVLQTPRTFESMSVLENVVLGAMFGSSGPRPSEPEAVKRGREALEFVGLDDRAHDEIDTLNLHEQRFLELARSLAGRPRLLLLDEVMAGLNDTELDSSINMVRTARDSLGVTVIWVEHVMNAVMSLAERAVVLDFGRVIADGRPDEAMRHPEVVEAYLGTGAVLDG